jgi:hypothetical protein
MLDVSRSRPSCQVHQGRYGGLVDEAVEWVVEVQPDIGYRTYSIQLQLLIRQPNIHHTFMSK